MNDSVMQECELHGGVSPLLDLDSSESRPARRSVRPAVRCTCSRCRRAARVLVCAAVPLSACGTETRSQLAFNAPDTRPLIEVEQGSGEVLLSLHTRDVAQWSRWVLDPDTGAVEEDLTRGSPLDRSWLAAPMRPRGDVYVGWNIVLIAQLALGDGSRKVTVEMGRYAWPGRTSPRETLVYVNDWTSLEVISLVDGATRSHVGIPELEYVLSLNVSPDSRWIALGDWVRYDPEDYGRGYHRERLVDAATGEVVRSVDFVGFRGWLVGPEPLAVADAPSRRFRREGPRYLAVGRDAERPLPIVEDVLAIAGLSDGRLVCTTYDERVVVVGADGALERTLRAPRRVE